MHELMRRSRVLVATAVVTLSLSVFAGSAAAANGPAFAAACNMVNGFVGTDASRGMGRAMSEAAYNGAAGMFHAFEVSGAYGPDCPVPPPN